MLSKNTHIALCELLLSLKITPHFYISQSLFAPESDTLVVGKLLCTISMSIGVVFMSYVVLALF